MEVTSSSGEVASDSSSQSLDIRTGETKLQVYRDPKEGDVQYRFVGLRSKFQDRTSWCGHVVDFLFGLQEVISDVISEYDLPIFTCHRRDGQIFRGHPNYRGLGK